MPGFNFLIKGQPCHMDVAGDYKVGDPEPEGYTDWIEWCEVHRKAKLKQYPCSTCSRWKWTTQLTLEPIRNEAFDKKGNVVVFYTRQCQACADEQSAKSAS